MVYRELAGRSVPCSLPARAGSPQYIPALARPPSRQQRLLKCQAWGSKRPPGGAVLTCKAGDTGLGGQADQPDSEYTQQVRLWVILID